MIRHAEYTTVFSRKTAGLSSHLKVKDIELREQYGFDDMDTNKVGIH